MSRWKRLRIQQDGSHRRDITGGGGGGGSANLIFFYRFSKVTVWRGKEQALGLRRFGVRPSNLLTDQL